MDEQRSERETDKPGDVGERLRRLQHLGVRRGRSGLAGPSTPAAAETGAQTTEPAGSAAVASGANAGLLQQVQGREVWTPFGPCVVAETRYDLDETRGLPLGAVLAVSGEAVAGCARDPALAGFDFGRAAFLDTETSGLAGGAGTFAFMVGIGTFHLSRFTFHEPQPNQDTTGAETRWPSYVVRQVFMRNPSEERALLHVTEQLLAPCTGLVSFNGRAFDAPLLRTRYLMHREPPALERMLHLDLLPAARQRWRMRLPSCALGALERDILAHHRTQEDVPGWLIPSIYQEYARSGDQPSQQSIDDMARVFYHNREDIVSMVPLAALLCAPFEHTGQALNSHSLHAVDTVSLGRCYEELGWLDVSEAAYRQALQRALPAEVRSQALRRLGWLLKRQERRVEAAAIWHDWITSVPGPDPTPYEELAKHHEWVEVDLAAARTWTLWGLHTAKQLPAGPMREQALGDLQHRLDRLERKIAGQLPADGEG